MYGVTIGDKHSEKDLGLILASKTISLPEPQTYLVEVPLRNGSIDLTEGLLDGVSYKDRTITMTFYVLDLSSSEWAEKISEIASFIHGQRLKIIFDEDHSFYYIGRLNITDAVYEKKIGSLVIEATVEPFKYDVNSTYSFSVYRETVYTIQGKANRAVPTITTDVSLNLECNGSTYYLLPGTTKIYNLFLPETENTLVFNVATEGTTANVIIEYVGGVL